jgi:SAM-dependent methyltransferase
MSFIPKDVIILPEDMRDHPDRWVAMNVFARSSLGISSEVLAFLGRAGSIQERERLDTAPDQYRCWEVEYFSNEDGLLADPTRYRRDPSAWREIRLDATALVAKLKAHCILIDDEESYRDRFQPKRNLLDRDHFGNFHQQHGQNLILNKREQPSAWWMKQKFTDDLRSVRADTLYGAIQWSFLEEYFAHTIKPGMKVLDLGCGTGIYANLLAKFGAEVRGVDPSDEYLDVARSFALPNTTFERADIGQPGGLAEIPSGWADVVFMSDALLFYYVPFYPGQHAEIQTLLADVKRILTPRGKFLSLEPHGVFYLSPWLGDKDRPFTLLTEYLHKSYGVVPPFSWLIRETAKAGFVVRDLLEIGPAEYFQKVDPRGYHFASEFPLWQLLELMPWE